RSRGDSMLRSHKRLRPTTCDAAHSAHACVVCASRPTARDVCCRLSFARGATHEASTNYIAHSTRDRVRLNYRPLLSAAIAALVFAVASCSSGGDGTTDPTPGENVDVTITLGTSTIEVTSGD